MWAVLAGALPCGLTPHCPAGHLPLKGEIGSNIQRLDCSTDLPLEGEMSAKLTEGG